MPLDIAAIRSQFKTDKAELLRQFTESRPTTSSARYLLAHMARLVDRTLGQLWDGSGMPKGAALVAVGGYGRGELFPHSDIDVLLLMPVSPSVTGDDSITPAVETFISACWDIGLEIGSSVRTVDECVEEAGRDITVQTALLEARLLCGARPRFSELTKATTAQLDVAAFVRAKTLEMRQRHNKHENTPYALEPNCKESPGGLRDLQVVIWLARAAGLGSTWQALARNGLLTAFEARQLQANEGLLKLIRARLHVIAGRREDRLVFDLQSSVAESFGYQNTPALRASEVLMRRYYWAAKAVTQLNQILMLNIEERVNGSQDAPMRPIDEQFLDRGGLLEVASDDVYKNDRHAILRTFLVLQREDTVKGLSARTLRALYNARGLMDAAFRNDPVNHAAFMDILKERHGQTRVLRLMNQTSVLGRYLWVFRRIVGQMQHDLFHVYTVDQHILMVVRNVRRYFIPEHAHEYPFCTQLASEWDKPWLLYVAALFHDVAKGRGGDHSELGAVEVRRFCKDHGITGDDAKLIEYLVAEHLTMSRVAQKEDLSDPDVIQAFARRVGNERTLTALYLLTVADIRGTSPKVWNAWKGKLLEDLYKLTLRALGGARPHMDAEIESRKQQARRSLALRSLPDGIEVALWKTLDVGYFARHDPADIAWHARSISRYENTPQPLVRARLSSVGEGLQVLVYSPDKADLFARICGYFDRAGFNIQDARVHTTNIGYALDTFQIIAGPNARHEGVHYRDLIALVETQLAEALASEAPLHEPIKGRMSRRVKSFPIRPRVSLRPDERGQRWLLSVSASDRSGLLYGIARVLARHQVSLQLAKIDTLGERVEDTFLLTGPTLRQDRVQLALETELLEALAA
ncbi:[protein-PII] uridylyltransferase [Aquabacterium soli]|uniref:Bifunctional uridylyltransferase/uridylyl-removing enzyme n=1 Tax=Aquabacterium soli TaxID=2493092 RepID=A0A426VFD2_9BURK|nr:[protein-PII] uridylyltransferase [Aquabacterium soli]RRS05607.1 [protein-PII] uridylyltransferase [Aquabacterium soli]